MPDMDSTDEMQAAARYSAPVDEQPQPEAPAATEMVPEPVVEPVVEAPVEPAPEQVAETEAPVVDVTPEPEAKPYDGPAAE